MLNVLSPNGPSGTVNWNVASYVFVPADPDEELLCEEVTVLWAELVLIEDEKMVELREDEKTVELLPLGLTTTT